MHYHLETGQLGRLPINDSASSASQFWEKNKKKERNFLMFENWKEKKKWRYKGMNTKQQVYTVHEPTMHVYQVSEYSF